MRKITEFFMKRPVIFWSLVVAILVAGVMSFMAMPKLEDPAVAVKQATVVVLYPGANAHRVELDVVKYMEDQLRALPDVEKITTECKSGMATITVEFKMTVLNEDLEQHFDLLRRKVSDASLPQDCYAPMVIDDMMDVYGIFYALTGDGYSYPELYEYASYLGRELQDVAGVKRVIIGGNRTEVINITLNRNDIAEDGTLPMRLMSALQSNSKVIDAGKMTSGEELIPITIESGVMDEEDIEEMYIGSLDGKQLRLGDIAKVERAFMEPQRNGFFVNGEPALAICLAMENDAIVPKVGKAVDKRLAEAMEIVPAGISTEKIFFQPDKVSSAIGSFMVNLVESIAIVILLLMFTMGFRSGLIIGFGLLLTVAVSFPILLIMDSTLQRISLGAFIIAMGMLVDNSVVIMDGILVDKAKKLPPKQYLYRIGESTWLPLLAATVIAVSTFVSVYLSPDSAGEYCRDMFLVLCVSLLSSWVLALIQVPVCAKSWLPARHYKDGSKDSTMNTKMHRAVRRAIEYLTDHKVVTISTACVLLAVCGLGLFKAKNVFFPDFDYSQFVVECYFPSAESPNAVRDKLSDMTAMLRGHEDIDRISACTGAAPAHYCLVRPMTSGGDCYGELMIDCKDYKTVVKVVPGVRKQLREQFPEAYIRIRKYNFSISTSHTVEVEFSGPDPAVLKELSAKAEEIMLGSEYVDPYSVQNNWKPMGKTMNLSYDTQAASRSGVNRSDLANAIQASGEGMAIGVLTDKDRTVPVYLRVRESDGSTIMDFGDIPVWSTLNVHLGQDDAAALMTGAVSTEDLKDKAIKSTPLSAVTDSLSFGWDEDVVRRVNGRRAIEVECDPNPDNPLATPAKAKSDIKKAIESIEIPDGYSMRWVGEGDLQSKAIKNILKYVPITVFLILAILLFLFGSWKKVLLILSCFPFVVCGITPSLLLTGTPLTFMCLIGVIGLIGMMVKNAIVLVDEIGRLTDEEKMDPFTAVVEATVSRVRPVMMASLTTIFGMIPLLGDPMYGSMAVVIMGGLLVGTIITLVFLPVLYTAMFHIRKTPAKQ